ncbi:MAG: hypothetical protein AAF489_07840 [Bacteroidota bacterium]
MAIRLGNSCDNCENLLEHNQCNVHGVNVSSGYTCDSFEMKTSLKNDSNCTTCFRFEGPSCANPKKAAPNMLCSHWAPQNAQA